MGMKSSGGGEIVQVQGGHIVRSTGRKDRHSKVYTSKGPRDRRVRLSAYTAIQFYDVQDRLGYDRPSKAVDWLIKKAQSAIDKLAELPPWHPAGVAGEGAAPPSPEMQMPEQSESSGGGGYNFNHNHSHNHNHLHNNLNESSTSLAFFPTSSSASSINFQSFSVPEMAAPRAANQDLCLSLHSFQDHHAPATDQMGLFGEANFHAPSWGGSPAQNRGASAAAGFMFGSPAANQPMMFREPLQSSFASPEFGRFGLPEFCLPPQIHGGDDPSSASPSSHH